MITVPLLLLILSVPEKPGFTDVTEQMGLNGISTARVCLVDLNMDGFPDMVVDRHRVFMNIPADTDNTNPDSSAGISLRRKFEEIPADRTGLPLPDGNGPVVFADIDNDGITDAVITRYVDLNNEKWQDNGKRTAWCRGVGDGTFWPEQVIENVTPATTSAVAVADCNRDGKPDIYLGNWYEKYGESYDGYANELLLQTEKGWERHAPVEEGIALRKDDIGGRPTYGTVIAQLLSDSAADRPQLLDLNYGRRWNRLWVTAANNITWVDIAPLTGFDGDEIRHGRYPDWLKERAKKDPRFARDDEKPFRANGNTFDAAVADVDNDGDFDIIVSEITHGWAGESADRTRILFNRWKEAGRLDFETRPGFSLDRIPPDKPNWNQGDLFVGLFDFDNDGYTDVLVSSGDYPDNQRLRIYQNIDGLSLREVTAELGIDHDGSQQVSFADIDGDGALDFAVGQTFFRYTAEMKKGRSPQLRVFLNRAAGDNHYLLLRLEGDPRTGVNRAAIGAVAIVEAGNRRLMGQLIPVGGHSGKQNDYFLHFGLADAEMVDRLTVRWPGDVPADVFEKVTPGTYRLKQGGDLVPFSAD